jgi:hypothetical protein
MTKLVHRTIVYLYDQILNRLLKTNNKGNPNAKTTIDTLLYIDILPVVGSGNPERGRTNRRPFSIFRTAGKICGGRKS